VCEYALAASEESASHRLQGGGGHAADSGSERLCADHKRPLDELDRRHGRRAGAVEPSAANICKTQVNEFGCEAGE